MKTCYTCGVLTPLAGFHKNTANKDGLAGSCKLCKRQIAKTWAEQNPERVKSAYERRKTSGHTANYYVSDAVKARLKAFYSTPNQLAKHAAKQQRRRAIKLQATPPWLNDTHRQEIEAVHQQAKTLELESGMPYHVDHIIPLRGKKVCGLHVPWNLQALPAIVNLKKSNKVEECWT